MIRPALPADLHIMMQAYNEAIVDRVFANCDVLQEDPARFAASYLADRQRYVALVDETPEDGVTGWGALKRFSARPDDAAVAEVAVYIRRDVRARGTGIRLLRALEAHAGTAGFATLMAIILGPNQASIRGCISGGFEECVRLPEIAQAGGQRVDIVWFQKNI